jgi:hypothetical protein
MYVLQNVGAERGFEVAMIQPRMFFAGKSVDKGGGSIGSSRCIKVRNVVGDIKQLKSLLYGVRCGRSRPVSNNSLWGICHRAQLTPFSLHIRPHLEDGRILISLISIARWLKESRQCPTPSINNVRQSQRVTINRAIILHQVTYTPSRTI